MMNSSNAPANTSASAVTNSRRNVGSFAIPCPEPQLFECDNDPEAGLAATRSDRVATSKQEIPRSRCGPRGIADLYRLPTVSCS
jgi:hypothetical protein